MPCINRKDGLDEKRFPYNDREAFRKVVSLIEPQESLVEFLKPFPEVCYIIRYVLYNVPLYMHVM